MSGLETSSDELVLTLQLMAEMCKGNTSRHAQYLNTLPRAPFSSSPLHWTNDELPVLARPGIPPLRRRTFRATPKLFNALFEGTPADATSLPYLPFHSEPIAPTNCARFMLRINAAGSRAPSLLPPSLPPSPSLDLPP